MRKTEFQDDVMMDHDQDGDGAINLSTSQRPSASTTPNGELSGPENQDNDQVGYIEKKKTKKTSPINLKNSRDFEYNWNSIRGRISGPYYIFGKKQYTRRKVYVGVSRKMFYDRL